jgi:preprotein translocase subunit SecE
MVMENQTQKWVNLAFVAVSAILGALVFWTIQKLAGVYDLETKVRKFQVVVPAVSVVSALILFAVLYFNKTANRFMNEVVTELSKVTWPTNKEVTSGTFVTVVMVLISGVILGLLDYVWTLVMGWIL